MTRREEERLRGDLDGSCNGPRGNTVKFRHPVSIIDIFDENRNGYHSWAYEKFHG